MRGRGVRVGVAVLIAATAVAAMSATSASVEPEPVLPDLVADAPTGAYIASFTDRSGTRLLLRFNGYVHNRGAGALELRGYAPSSGTMTTVRQRVYDNNGGWTDRQHQPKPVILYEPNDTHNHWHLRGVARYSLWNEGRTAKVARAMKVGFCLLDSQRVDGWGPTTAAYTRNGIAFCKQNKPKTTTVRMGISPGWRDIYGRALAFQWVDISDVDPGRYWLRSEVDPDDVIGEANEANKPAWGNTVTTVPGHIAKSFVQRVDPFLVLASAVELQTDKFGSPAAPQFRITDPPDHGRLNKTTGEWFSGRTVQYTPNVGYQGQDFFTFEARSSNGFPLTPKEATAWLGVRTDPQPGSSGGEEILPSVGGVADPRRAPDVQGPLPSPDGFLLAAPVLQVHHGDLLVRTIARASGTVRIAADDGIRSLGGCEVRAVAGQVITCLLAEGIHGDLHGARVAATLTEAGRLLASRTGVLQVP